MVVTGWLAGRTVLGPGPEALGRRAAVGSAGGAGGWATPVLAENRLQQATGTLSSHSKPGIIAVEVTPRVDGGTDTAPYSLWDLSGLSSASPPPLPPTGLMGGQGAGFTWLRLCWLLGLWPFFQAQMAAFPAPLTR